VRWGGWEVLGEEIVGWFRGADSWLGALWIYTVLLVHRGGQECPPHTSTGGAGEQQVPRFARNDRVCSE